MIKPESLASDSSNDDLTLDSEVPNINKELVGSLNIHEGNIDYGLRPESSDHHVIQDSLIPSKKDELLVVSEAAGINIDILNSANPEKMDHLDAISSLPAENKNKANSTDGIYLHHSDNANYKEFQERYSL